MSFTIQIDTSALEKKLTVAAQTRLPVEARVNATGKAKDYAFVLEYGSKPGARPWPDAQQRTTTGQGGRIFSKQAPQGYVRRFGEKFIQFLRDALTKRIKGGNLPSRSDLVGAANEAATNALSLIKAAAPVGDGKNAGQLRDSLEVEQAN